MLRVEEDKHPLHAIRRDTDEHHERGSPSGDDRHDMGEPRAGGEEDGSAMIESTPSVPVSGCFMMRNAIASISMTNGSRPSVKSVFRAVFFPESHAASRG